VLGDTGRGLAEAAKVEADVDFVIGTFSKSLGAIGGYCVSDHPEFDVLRVRCRPYMFTASLPPSIIASVAAALKVVGSRPELRTRLWANVRTLYDGLKRRGFTFVGSTICYAFMQAVGMVDDHAAACFKSKRARR